MEPDTFECPRCQNDHDVADRMDMLGDKWCRWCASNDDGPLHRIFDDPDFPGWSADH